MASAQQKPKKEKGVRNGARPNGKAWKRSENPHIVGKQEYLTVIDRVIKVYDTHQPTVNVVSREVIYQGKGIKVSGKGKASGCTYRGIALYRVSAMAAKRGISFDEMCDVLDSKYQAKKTHRASWAGDNEGRLRRHEALMLSGKDKANKKSNLTYTGD